MPRKARPKAPKAPRPNTGLAEEWRNLPMRRCKNCGRAFRPKRPEQLFHSTECRKAYHNSGGPSFTKFRGAISKEIRGRMRFTEKCPDCNGRPGPRCEQCGAKGLVLTEHGEALVHFLWPRIQSMIDERIDARLGKVQSS